MNEYQNKRVLVTGGTGLVGRQVVDLLIDAGATVKVISLDNLTLNPQAIYRPIDLRDFDLCKKYTQGMDYVFHLAGIKASPDITNKRPSTMSIPALQMNVNVLEACRINGIQNVLFTSSIGAYAEAEILNEDNAYKGNPMDFFPGMVKRMAEFQIQSYQWEYDLRYKVVRLANVYGPGDNFNPDNGMFISSLMAKVLRGDNPVTIWGDGSANRDFVYSGDVARGILQVMLNATACAPINLGSGAGYTVAEVVKILHDLTKFDFKFDTSKPSGVAKRVMDISRARQYGYQPVVTLKDGIKETWKWFQANPEEYKRRMNYFETRTH